MLPYFKKHLTNSSIGRTSAGSIQVIYDCIEMFYWQDFAVKLSLVKKYRAGIEKSVETNLAKEIGKERFFKTKTLSFLMK